MSIFVPAGVLLVLAAGAGLAFWYFNRPDPPGKETAEKPGKDRAKPADSSRDLDRRTDAGPRAKSSSLRLPALPEAKQTRVNQAIARGVQFLKSAQEENGGWAVIRSGSAYSHAAGAAALPALTLLECGVPATDPMVQKAAARVRSAVDPLTSTYSLAMAVLFLDRLGEKQKDRELIRAMTLRLVAGQTSRGGWGYVCPPLNNREREELARLLHDVRNQVGVRVPKLTIGSVSELPAPLRKLALLRNQPDVRVPVEPDEPPPAYDDNSNTQFAVLALLAARSHDVPVDRTLALVAKRFRITQQANGSWSYHFAGAGQVSRFPTMTCAGLLGLALGHSLVRDARRRGEKLEDLTDAGELPEDPHIKKALQWLGQHIGGDMDTRLDLYYLWSVERVGVIFQLPRIHGKEWYPWGVDILLAQQKDNGSWQAARQAYPSLSTVDTSLALLFLKRADLARGLTRKLLVED
jgi:hypothetical protein